MDNRMTFEDWLKSQTCNDCEIPLDMSFFSHNRTVFKIRDIDHTKVKGHYCVDCHEKALANLMNSRFVEVYRGYELFVKDGNYALWQSATYCKSLEALKNWVDVRLKWMEEDRKHSKVFLSELF